MLGTVRHVTQYRYSDRVFCEPLTIRLRPRCDHRQRLLTYSLVVEPQPQGFSELVDLEGNNTACAWFGESTDYLTISSSLTAETTDVDPFQFLLRPDADRLPLRPCASERPHFDIYAASTLCNEEVEELAAEIAREVDRATVPFVSRINHWVFANHEKIVRDTGSAWPPLETLDRGKGACRDLAVLFIELCRAMNIPARFVSGYFAEVDGSRDRQLHAWAEVYLPGAGWRGFDPSLGLAITDRHLAIAAGRTPATAAPITGAFRGTVESQMTAEIEMHTSAGGTAMAPVVQTRNLADAAL
jgi:transglutaminase-like putative cysteine protease